MNIINKGIEICKLLNNLPYDLYKFVLKRPIILDACVRINKGKLQHNNFGDDINIYFIEAITKRKVIIYHESLLCRFFKLKHVLAIGSIVENADKKTIIWGAGAQLDKMRLNQKPLKVLAVRGPLTRDYLIESGIECPAIYGDPALLLSKFYKPNIPKKYRLGIIPHILDQNNQFLVDFTKKYPNEVLFIDLKSYSVWTDVIDQICSCEFIVSSSLHGLIVSDSYNVPNAWIQFGERVLGGNGFKYYDYFASVKREKCNPYVIDKEISLEDLLILQDKWKHIDIDLAPLLSVCPFKLFIK